MRALKRKRPTPTLLLESRWCDSACDRCPLVDRCNTGQSISRRVREMERRDGPHGADGLGRARVIIENASIEPGFLPEEYRTGPTPKLARRADGLGDEILRAAFAMADAAVQSEGVDEAVAGRFVGDVAVLMVKTSSVAWGFGTRSPEPADMLHPTLLLIEHLNAQLCRDARRLAPFAPAFIVEIFEEAHEALIRLVKPWIARVGAAARAQLKAQIEEGSAPSPFCRRSELTTVS